MNLPFSFYNSIVDGGRESSCRLFSEQPENYRQDYADDNACRDGKVKTETFFFDVNVAGQSARKRQLVGAKQNKSGNNKDDSQSN